MTKKQFDKYFVPLAKVWIHPDHVSDRSVVYFQVLKDFPEWAWKSVSESCADNDERLPVPAEFKRRLREVVKASKPPVDEYRSPPDNIVNSPSALRERKKFHMKITEIRENLIRRGKKSDIIEGLYEELVMKPFKEQTIFEGKNVDSEIERMRAETIRKAKQEAEKV
jgi:hypothetical protein